MRRLYAIQTLQAAARGRRARVLLRQVRSLPRELQCKISFYMREPLLLQLYHYRPIAKAVARYVASIPPIIWDSGERRAVKHAHYLLHKYSAILDRATMCPDQLRWVVFVGRHVITDGCVD